MEQAWYPEIWIVSWWRRAAGCRRGRCCQIWWWRGECHDDSRKLSGRKRCPDCGRLWARQCRNDLAATLTEPDVDDAEKMMRLIDRLDDVQAVYSNADISDEIMVGLDWQLFFKSSRFEAVTSGGQQSETIPARWYNKVLTVTNMTALLSERITIDASICHGKPCIRGLRYPVENILEWLSAGMSVEDILADYEDLEREDIMAALAFAAQLIKVQRMHRWRHEVYCWCAVVTASCGHNAGRSL